MADHKIRVKWVRKSELGHFHAEKVAWARRGRSQRAASDRAVIEGERLEAAVAGVGLTQRPRLQIRANPHLVGPAGGGLDRHGKERTAVSARRLKTRGRRAGICPGNVVHDIGGPVAIGIRQWLDARVAEILSFPCVGQTVGIGIRVTAGALRRGKEHLDHPGLERVSGAGSAAGFDRAADGRLVLNRSATRDAATRVHVGTADRSQQP